MTAATEGVDRRIQIEVNGFAETVPAGSTVAALIERFKELDINLIVELNGRYVYPEKYEITEVNAGDRLEFVNPDFGG